MKTKKTLIIIAALALLIVLSGVIYASGMGKRLTDIFVPADEAEEFESSIFDAKGKVPEKTPDPYTELSTSDRFKAIATDEQKKLLEETERYDFLGPVSQYEKRMLQILGEIPENTPYITRERAVEILEGIDPASYASPDDYENAVVAAFNEIAAAPEFDGGSGMRIAVYFTDAAPTGYIRIRLGKVEYHKLSDDTVELLASCIEG